MKPSPKAGPLRISDQQTPNGVIHILRTGIPWEAPPLKLSYGNGMTFWQRLRNWQNAGRGIVDIMSDQSNGAGLTS